nr:MAG TPA: hypothetical protein [Caudoviricetes sp.]
MVVVVHIITCAVCVLENYHNLDPRIELQRVKTQYERFKGEKLTQYPRCEERRISLSDARV